MTTFVCALCTPGTLPGGSPAITVYLVEAETTAAAESAAYEQEGGTIWSVVAMPLPDRLDLHLGEVRKLTA